MHCYESVDGLPLAAVTVRRFKLLLKRIWVKVMFYNVLSHMHYFQASSVLHWFLVKCLIASWMQYNSVLFANMVYISKWYTAVTVKTQGFLRTLKDASVCVCTRVCTSVRAWECFPRGSWLGARCWELPALQGCLCGHQQVGISIFKYIYLIEK